MSIIARIDQSINLAREVEKRAFQAGLEAAADYLKGTASDYQQGHHTITTALRGEIKDDPATRSEFLRLAN